MADDRSSKEATEWLIRLQDDPDDQSLRRDFEAWRAASPTHEAAWLAVMRAYDLIGQAAIPAATITTPRRHRFGWSVGIAALAVATIALLCLPDVMLRLRADYMTATGEWRTVRLADGSMVTLGPATALAADVAGVDRRIRLLAGRAFFEVTHDPARPFTVEANGVRTTVLGTGFEVDLDSTDATVAVEHGVVQVDYPATAIPGSRRLRAGDWVRVGTNDIATEGTEPPEQVAAWRKGRLVVRDRPVSAVVEALRSSYAGVILVTGSAADDQRVTGVYDLHDPPGALQALAEAHGGHVYRLSPWLLVLSGA